VRRVDTIEVWRKECAEFVDKSVCMSDNKYQDHRD